VAFLFRLARSVAAEVDVADDLADTIRDSATGPAEAHGDAGGVKQHPLPDQIAADKYLASKNAMARKGLGLTRVKIIPPGTV
jgi:hypothetical protein